MLARGTSSGAETLEGWRTFLVAHNAVIMAVVFGILAATNLGNALGGLDG